MFFHSSFPGLRQECFHPASCHALRLSATLSSPHHCPGLTPSPAHPVLRQWGWKCYNLLRNRCWADGARDDLQHPLARFCCALSKTTSTRAPLGPNSKLWLTKWSSEQWLRLYAYKLLSYFISNMPHEDLSGHMMKRGQQQRKHNGAQALCREPYWLDRHFIAVTTTNILMP